MNKLSSRAVQTMTKAGRHSDGGGLYLNVKASGAKSWVFIYKRAGKKTEIGLGGLKSVGLKRARERAQAAREAVADSLDPRETLRPKKSKTVLDAMRATMDAQQLHKKSPKSLYQWERSLLTHCKPLHSLDLMTVRTADVVKAIKPVWNDIPETGRRTRARLEKVFDHARAMGWRDSDNPARWKGNLEHILPKQDRKVRHFPALPYAELPEFMTELKARPALSARMMEFAILTASRTGEVRFAVWSEIDFDAQLWIIPAERMKMDREHVVPLSEPALDILKPLYELRTSDYIFPSAKLGRPLSDGAMLAILKRMDRSDITPHGFRSTMRDWAGDETGFDREVIEFALSHIVGEEAERAYRRSTALDKRTRLMDAWADYAMGATTGKVIRFTAN